MACLDPATVDALAARLLEPTERDAALAHLASCAHCRQALHLAESGALGAELERTATSGGSPPRPGGDPDSGPIEQGITVGPYTLQERLGEGGMGVVFSAMHRELNRKVALKLIRTGPGSEGTDSAQARLLREAQAMARLSHPNVVTVYDAGSWENRVYLAMERVEGTTLREWLRSQHTWREVLQVFIQAGRGLAAAHRVGIVHRDFKPANVLVRPDGVTQVTDFGLARAVGEPSAEQSPASPAAFEQPIGLLGTPLTRMGAVVGTPGYMAPEQLLGNVGDPRADQFGFCVALYEALYAQRPFQGQLIPEKPQPVRPPPKDRRVPRFIHRALERGLRAAPLERFPSMDALLAELSRDPGRALRRGLAAVAGLAMLVAAVALGSRLARSAPAPECADEGREWAGTWDDGARAAVRSSFAATQAPTATDDAQAFIQALDRYTTAWARLHHDACEKMRSKPDESFLALGCLRRLHTEMAALASLAARADAEIEAHAFRAAGALAPPGRCADMKALTALPKPPADPKTGSEVETIRTALAGVAAEHEAGKYADAAQHAQALVERASGLGYRPIEAEALGLLGTAQMRLGRNALAQQLLERAEAAAEAGGADALAAEDAVRLVHVTGVTSNRPEEARRWETRARILLERLGGDPLIEARLDINCADMLQRQGNLDEARKLYERALTLRTEQLGPDHVYTLEVRSSIAGVDYTANRFEEGVEQQHRILAEQERVLGPSHPSLIATLDSLAAGETELGRYADAEKHARRAVALAKAAYRGLGENYLNELFTLAYFLTEVRRDGEAITVLQEAEEVLRRSAVGDDTLISAMWRAQRGTALLHLGKGCLAKADLERALQVLSPAIDKADPALVELRIKLGGALLTCGEPRRAVVTLAAALQDLSARAPVWKNYALARFSLARSLVVTHSKDRRRIEQLALQARDDSSRVPWRKAEREELEAWISSQRLTFAYRAP